MITYEEEVTLWDREVLRSSTPKRLFSTIFFMNGKVLYASEEQFSQFTFGIENKREYVEYTEIHPQAIAAMCI